jgi:hypothetical protein
MAKYPRNGASQRNVSAQTRRTNNKSESEPSKNETTDWPNPTPLITSIAGAAFLASLIYAYGLARGLGMDLLGYFDIQDFLRIAPAWALPALGAFLLNEWSSYVRGTGTAAQVDKTPVAKESLWRTILQVLVNPDEGIYHLSVILFAWLFVRFFRHQDYWAILLWFSNGYMFWRPAIWYVRRVQKSSPRQRFVFGFIPIRALPSLVFLLAISFGYGLYMEPLILRWAPLATVELKQNNSIVEGKVIVQLSRYVVLRRSDKSVVAIESSNILKISRPEDERSMLHHVKPTPKK